MKIKDLNNTIINAMIQTGTVIDCKEGYMEITQQSLSEPTLTISVPSTVTVGTPTTITVTASVVGDITVYINQEYYQTSIGQSTMSFTYTPQDTFTIEAYFSSTQGISVNASQEVVLIDFTPAVQSFNPLGDNYNDVFQEWLYNNGYSEHEEYTTMEEALNVEEIPDYTFEYNQSLTHMDELQYFTNLTNIGQYTFFECENLTSITIPDSVTSIGDYVFGYAHNLASVNIPNGVTSIGEGAFYDCDNLTSITIPDSVTSIGEMAFSGCNRITSVIISNSITNINDATFNGCTRLTSITIPNGVTSIGGNAFYGCTGLTSIIIPNGVTYIDDYAFQGCTGLTIVNIPNSVTTIKRNVFAGCTGLTSVTIPNSITTVPTGMFDGCTGLTNLTIPNSIREIGGGAFQDCTSLYRIYCYAITPPYVNDYAFKNVNRSATVYVPQGSGNAYRNADIWEEFNIEEMSEIPDSWAVQSTNPAGDKYNPALQVWAKASGYSAENDYTTKTEAQAVTMIEANEFNNNTNLTSINELQYFTNLSIINDYAFRGTTNLTTGILPSSVTDIYVGAFQNSGIQALNPRMPYDPTDYTKGASNVTASSVNRYAFAGSNITSVTFGEYTTTVGASAFEGCLSLRNVYGEDSGWISVQNNTFKNCSMLKNIYLPSTVTMLLNNVVDGCTALEAIWCYATTPPSVTASTFTNMAADVTLYVPYESLSAYQSSSWANYFSSILPISAPQTYAVQSTDPNGINYNNVFQEWLYSNGHSANAEYTTMEEALNLTEIPDNAFFNNTSLTHMDELQYFTNLTNIGNYAFLYCTGLTSIIIPNNVTTVGSNAFTGCTGLTSATIGDGVTSLLYGTFSNCTSLTSVYIGSSVSSIRRESFDGCTALTHIQVSPNNSTYDSRDNCNAIIETATNSLEIGFQSTVIPNSVTTIKASAFFECTALRNITIPNTVTTIGRLAFVSTGLTSIALPNSITSWGYSVFQSCTSLTSIIFESGVTTVPNFYFHECTSLIQVTLPGSVTTIEPGAFDDCAALSTITIPSSVTNIGNYAFRNTGLTSIRVEAITPPTITNNATTGTFANVDTTIPVYVPSESVTAYQNSLWGSYFSNILPMPSPVTYACQSIDSNGANYNPVFQEWLYNNGIASNSGYTTTTEALSLTELPDQAFKNKTSLTHMDELQYFTNLTTIDTSAFNGCSSLSSIIIPNSVTNIRGGAFYNCTGLTSITIPNSVTIISHTLFYGCTGLTSVTIPNSITSIDNDAFSGCSSLTSITIPSSVTSIGESVFWYCTGLTNIIIPNGITRIKSGTFYHCEGLTSFTIPSGVTYIGDTAFWGCVNLSKVYCNAINPPSMGSGTFENDENIDLYVPSASISAYQNNTYWDGFRSYNAI